MPNRGPFQQSLPENPWGGSGGLPNWQWNPTTGRYEDRGPSGGGFAVPGMSPGTTGPYSPYPGVGGAGNVPATLPTTSIPGYGAATGAVGTTAGGTSSGAVQSALAGGAGAAGGRTLAGVLTGAAAGGPFGFWGPIVGGLFDYLGARSAANTATDVAEQQANAARDAAKLLADAQKEALDFQKSQWAQTQENMKPWLSMGSSAVTTLGKLMGLSPADIPTVAMPTTGATGAPVAGQTSATGRAGAGGPPGILTGGVAVPRPTTPPRAGGGGPGGTPTGGVAVPRQNVTNALTRSFAPSTGAGTQLQAAPPPVTGSQVSERRIDGGADTGMGGQPTMAGTYSQSTMVTWPDGTTSRVPTSQLARYIALGATPAGGQMMPQMSPGMSPQSGY